MKREGSFNFKCTTTIIKGWPVESIFKFEGYNEYNDHVALQLVDHGNSWTF